MREMSIGSWPISRSRNPVTRLWALDGVAATYFAAMG
jgi:hypothetical protein